MAEDPHPNLQKPFKKLTAAEQRQEEREFNDGHPARNDDGSQYEPGK